MTMNSIDEIIKTIRSDLSKITCDHDQAEEDLFKFVGVDNSRSYGFIIDSLYLFEDTQLAKHSFLETDLQSLEFGHIYLLTYGVLNACYMQQQAILVVCNELAISSGIKEIKNAEIITFRNSFSAHTPNRGKGAYQHSFILDRHAMRSGLLKGYSSNHQTGFYSMSGNILQLIASWDSELLNQFEKVYEQIYKNT